jgi:hypothetical protein
MLLRIGVEACPYCRSLEVYRSRPETWLDRVFALFLFDIARCHGCMRQHYRYILFPAPEFPIQSEEQEAKNIKPDEWKRSA